MQFTIPGKKVNAIAFGFPGLNAIAVTRGALEQLTEDELTGALAHEYVHINQCHTLIRMGWSFGADFAIKRIKNNRALTNEQKRNQVMGAQITYRTTAVVMSYVMERLADRGAKKKGHGVALASALSKVDDRSTMHILGMLFGHCHPRSSTRIRRLTNI